MNRLPLLPDSYALWRALQDQSLDLTARDPWWWPNSGTFDVVVGALLTQQSRWNKVEDSLENLRKANLLSPLALARTPLDTLIPLIKPSGFYNTKAPRLIGISQQLLTDFGDFSSFQTRVTREWLLARQGIGEETSDAILCYGCYHPAMVVDAYTLRMLQALGYDSLDYRSAQQWLIEGLEPRQALLMQQTRRNDMALTYAHFHGLIVEYAKRRSQGKTVHVDLLIKSMV